jgi:hypothetical protein
MSGTIDPDLLNLLGSAPVSDAMATSGLSGAIGNSVSPADLISTLGGAPTTNAAASAGLNATVGGGVDWSKLPGALQGAAGAAKDLNTSKGNAIAPPTQNIQPGKAGGGAAQLNQLIQMLRDRNAAYFPGSGQNTQPVQIGKPLGLLGF